jgi:hypothetical protein
MLFLRIFQHLLPTGEAWRTTVDKALRRFFAGLAPAGEDAREFIDLVHLDLFPDTTRQLAEWERQFGLAPAANALEVSRRAALAAEWQATGGQSPGYIQGVLRTAGFDVYVHEWWVPPSGAPWFTRDPRDYTETPLFGTIQCGEDDAICGEAGAICNRDLANEPGYFDNLDLSNRAPAAIPSDPDFWPYFFYVGAETFPEVALIDVGRRGEFERLIQKIKPAQQWVVTLISYTGALITEDGDTLITEDGDTLAS